MCVHTQYSGYELGHYFLLLIHTEQNPAVLSVQACAPKLSVLLLEDAAGAKRESDSQTPGPPNLMVFVAAHFLPPPMTREDEEKYPWPTADPPQCQSNSWHGRSTAGVFVSFSLQPEHETLPKVQIGHILLRTESKEDRQTSRPATLPELRSKIRWGGEGATATFYFWKLSQKALWSVCPPCPFVSAEVPGY